MDRMLVRQRQADNARDFGPKFIIAFPGKSGNLCVRRRGEQRLSQGGEETMVLRPSLPEQHQNGPQRRLHYFAKSATNPALQVTYSCEQDECQSSACAGDAPIRPAFRHPSAAVPQLVSAETCHLAWPRCRRTWPR